jgi:hypothetical protein
MKTYEEFEQKAIEKTKNKKAKMKVSGKSVFIIEKASRNIKKSK